MEFSSLVARRETTFSHVHNRPVPPILFLKANIYVTKYHEFTILHRNLTIIVDTIVKY
jgi:hypothetical protein